MLNWIKNIFKKEGKSEIETIKIRNKIEYIQITKDWNADPVSPEVILDIKNNNLEMEIYLNYYVFDKFKEGDKVKITFENCTKYSLNTCNDEGYYYGQYRIKPTELEWGEFYELKSGIDSNFPEPVMNIQGSKTGDRHFIFFFKDETFECLASDYSMIFFNENTKKRIYKILLDGKEIGTSELEKGDAPMGVAMGTINFNDKNFGYKQIKEFWENNNIELATDYPKDKMISTMSTDKLKVINPEGVEIKGAGNQITGMDNSEYEISVFGISYSFYETEFPNLVKEYKDMYNEK